jgi:hypothetical protein
MRLWKLNLLKNSIVLHNIVLLSYSGVLVIGLL